MIGTVPVAEDGSAKFMVPANMPVAVQPLDEQGRAMQLMRSWMTAMPGEVLQCNGCHESQNDAALLKTTLAINRPPVADHSLARADARFRLLARSPAGHRPVLRRLP